jgi:hypothetical protein
MQGVKKYLLYDAKIDKPFPRVGHPALSLFYQSVKCGGFENFKIGRLKN